MRAIFATALLASVLAAGSAEACRSSDYQQELLFSDLPPLGPGDTQALEVEIRRVDVKNGYAWAEVQRARVGTFAGRKIRIQVRRTSCGPFPKVGDRGLLVGRIEVGRDTFLTFVPQLDSPARRKERQKSRP